MFEGVRKSDQPDGTTPPPEQQPPAPAMPQQQPPAPEPQQVGAPIPAEALDSLQKAGFEAMEDEAPSRRFAFFLVAAGIILVGGIVVVLLFANPFAKKETRTNTNSAVNTNTNVGAQTDWKTYRNTVLAFSIAYPPEWGIDQTASTANEVVFETGTASATPESITVTQTTQTITEWQNVLLLQYDNATIADTTSLRIGGFATSGVVTNTSDGTFYALSNGAMRYVFQTSGLMKENGMLDTFRVLSAATNTNTNTNTNANTNVTVNGNENTNADTNLNTNTSPIDTDRDGLPDAQEQDLGTNPLVADTDGDGLSDYHEVVVYGSDPLKTDTDGDGYSDGDEVRNNYNPVGPGTLTP